MTIIRINDLPYAFDLLYAYSQEIGRDLSDEQLRIGLQKFLNHGNVLGVVKDDRIIAMLNVYCNNYTTRQAYINNVYVLPEYRGQHIATRLVSEAIALCRHREFQTITLHVLPDNTAAIAVYEKLGFVFTDSQQGHTVEMKLSIDD